jgi:hypothetical protein
VTGPFAVVVVEEAAAEIVVGAEGVVDEGVVAGVEATVPRLVTVDEEHAASRPTSTNSRALPVDMLDVVTIMLSVLVTHLAESEPTDNRDKLVGP